MTKTIETDVLIVGAGPAGASTMLFLARQGIRTLTISRHRGVADTPRAHIVNQRTMEALRDAGVEPQCLDVATPGPFIANTFWLESLTGAEYARAWGWGNHPARASDYLAASPCQVIDLPQDRMEPILISEATRLGAHMRFGWELQSFTQDDDGVTATIADRLSGAETTVRAKYMVGADGARSRVVEQLGLPLTGQVLRGGMFNVMCEMDLSKYTMHRHASFYNVVQPQASWSPVAVIRLVRRWNTWLVGLIVNEGAEDTKPTNDEYVARIREVVGDANLQVKILSTSQWQVNEIHADNYSSGRVFCMGDAVHRHPPANALGSNTCIQDGFNLAWKLALVLKGQAHASLLDSYNAERQPVGKEIVARANKSMRQAFALMGFFIKGMHADTPEGRKAYLQAPPMRAHLRKELTEFDYNSSALGVEMTRRYHSGAVVPDGTPEPAAQRDPELHYEPSTWPGRCLPHGWLVSREPGPLVSTLDVTGKGMFRLLTSHGGEAWRDAAAQVGKKLGIEIGVTSIGACLDYEDPYGDWERLRGVEDNGCVLVRPDHIVGWRSASLPADATTALQGVMNKLLGWA